MKRLITVADDFGFSSGVNRGCIEAFEKGILKEMSFMVDSPGSIEAVSLMKNYRKHVGIHITLNDLVGTGVYLRTSDYDKLLRESPKEKLEQRVEEEFKKFEDLFGRVPSHINSHHSVHSHPKLIDVVSGYAIKNNIFVRRKRNFTDGNNVESEIDVNKLYLEKGVKMTDNVFEQIKGTYDSSYNGFIDNLQNISEGTTTELFFHPAYVDETILKYTSLTYDRERDTKLLLDESFKKSIEDLGFTISDFGSI